MISDHDVPRRVTHWHDKSILMCDRTDLLNLANYLAHFLAVRGLKAPGVRLSDLNQPKVNFIDRAEASVVPVQRPKEKPSPRR